MTFDPGTHTGETSATQPRAESRKVPDPVKVAGRDAAPARARQRGYPLAELEELKAGAKGWTVTTDRSDAELCLLAVHAHPDDEASKGAATLARYADEGVRTVVVTCTGGERGEVLNPALAEELAGADLAAVRRREMEEAARILRLDRHYWLGFEDSGMSASEPPSGSFAAASVEDASARLVEILRLERPQVVLTYDEWGGYPHPDHIKTHRVTMAAVEAAADPTAFPELGDPHEVAKVYYHATFTKKRLQTLHELLIRHGLDSPFERIVRSRASWPEKEVTTKVFVAPWLEARRQALRAHRSQVAEDSFFLALPDEVLAAHFPNDEYHLALSRVDTRIPETDLFSGIRRRTRAVRSGQIG